MDKSYEVSFFSEIDKFAVDSYCAVHNTSKEKNLGDITKIDENKLPEFTMSCSGSPCFVEGTLVLTDKGYIPIEEIQIGDKVLTHTNKYQRVLKTMVNQAKETIGINASPSEMIFSTLDHPYYVRKRERKVIEGKSTRYFLPPIWKKANEITNDYYVGTAVNQESKLPEWNGYDFPINKSGVLKHKNELSEMFHSNDFWYIVGRYIGDGWLKKYDGKTFIICAPSEKVCQITDRFDNLGIHYCVVKERTVCKIQVVKKEMYLYLEQFGYGAANKHLIRDVLDLPIDKCKSFLEGYIDSDGTFSQNKYKITSVSRRLIYEVGQCIAKVYKRPFSIYFTQRPKTCTIEGRVVNQRDTYQICWKLDNCIQDKAFYEDGYIWSPISKIRYEQSDELVYNLEVEKDNSYVVQNVIVHNCQDFSLSGKQQGSMWECRSCGETYNPLTVHHSKRKVCPKCGSNDLNKTRSSLLVEWLRTVKAVKPKWIIYENVKNIVGKKFKETFDMFTAELNEYGYNTYYKVLNAKDYGIPQNRERVYVIGIKKELDNGKFEFPKPFDNGKRLKDMLDDEVDESYYLNNDRADNCIKDIIASGKLDKEYSNSIRVGGEALSTDIVGI